MALSPEDMDTSLELLSHTFCFDHELLARPSVTPSGGRQKLDNTTFNEIAAFVQTDIAVYTESNRLFENRVELMRQDRKNGLHCRRRGCVSRCVVR